MNRNELLEMSLAELIYRADSLRQKNGFNQLKTCSIINAKSGRCTEDCRFCAQSGHHKTQVDVYALKSKDEIVAAASEAKEIGAERFGIVTSGNRLSDLELKQIALAVKEITSGLGLRVCGSLGALCKDEFAILKAAGMSRYHHNIETSRDYYPSIVSTHSFEERIRTIQFAKELGFEVCSGGIIGLGESWQDRIAMAEILKELEVDSIPINILVPIEGTKIFGIEEVSPEDVIRTIAIFRIINPFKTIRIAAGRESKLKDHQALAFMAGADGMMIGGYLTVKGRSVEEDAKLIQSVEKMWNS